MKHDFNGIIRHKKVIRTDWEIISGCAAIDHYGIRHISFSLNHGNDKSIICGNRDGFFMKQNEDSVAVQYLGQIGNYHNYQLDCPNITVEEDSQSSWYDADIIVSYNAS